MNISRIVLRDVNPELLVEEVRSLGLSGATFSGFERVSNRLMTPLSESKVVARFKEGSTTREVTAEPGQVDFEAPADPGAALDSILASHDPTLRTQAQMDRDSYDADRELLRQELDAGGQISRDGITAMARLVAARK
ncbi:MAG: hypothetical protein GTO00_09130 [Deltaproteobacteria bacterium]|nr:hypothetical protein [Deltaproteobacteria bacterium]